MCRLTERSLDGYANPEDLGYLNEPGPKIPDSPWSTKVLNLQIAWDSTSMRTLQECPWKYYLSQIHGYTSREFRAPLTYGILMHRGAETYHKAKAEGQEYEEAVRTTVQFALRDGTELNQSDDNTRTRFTLVRALVWYLTQFKDDPAETYILANGKPAVELSFRVALELDSPDGIPYLWCGHIDRLVHYMKSISVSDLKTSAYALSDKWFQRFKTSGQISGYMFASKIILPDEPAKQAIIDGVELKVNFNRYKRGLAHRTDDQLHEWAENTLDWIRAAERYAEADKWPMNLESCDKYGGCPFQKDVCSRDPSTRKTWLEGLFNKVHWNPLENREQ